MKRAIMLDVLWGSESLAEDVVILYVEVEIISGSQTSCYDNHDPIILSNLMGRAPWVRNSGANLLSSDIPFPSRVGTGFGPRHSNLEGSRRVQVTI